MKKKAHLAIPEKLPEEVDKTAGKRNRILSVAEAIREKLERERFLKTLEKTKGTWTANNHPELQSAGDIDRYVREKRQELRFICQMPS